MCFPFILARGTPNIHLGHLVFKAVFDYIMLAHEIGIDATALADVAAAAVAKRIVVLVRGFTEGAASLSYAGF